MTRTVVIDLAGARMGGAARYAAELRSYLTRTGRQDVQIIGDGRRVDPVWLIRRETMVLSANRRVALNNVSFVAPGSERWMLLRNALHFLTDTEAAGLSASLRASMHRESAIVRLSARRADTIVVPSNAMADRVIRQLPSTQARLVVRPHPVSADSVPRKPRDPAILCPVLFASYKQMGARLAELLQAVDRLADPAVLVRITAASTDLPSSLAAHPGIEFVGRLDHRQLRDMWARSRAIYFPTGLESFGYPLAEARVSGHPIIARDTSQNKEIAGAALCGFRPGDADSLYRATTRALAADVTPDPAPFDPDSYFGWLLGCPP